MSKQMTKSCPRLRPYTERDSLDGDEYCFNCDYEGTNFEECPIYTSKFPTDLVPLDLTPQAAMTYLLIGYVDDRLRKCVKVSKDIVRILKDTKKQNKNFFERMAKKGY